MMEIYNEQVRDLLTRDFPKGGKSNDDEEKWNVNVAFRFGGSTASNLGLFLSARPSSRTCW